MQNRVVRAAVRRNLGALGLTSTEGGLLDKAVATGATVGVSAIAAGAGAGSLAGPIGTVAGAVIGAVVGILTQTSNTASHIGTWDGQIVAALSALPSSAAGIGRQIPWNENSHGLVQIIEALLAVGVYMAWDTSLKSNYDVCAHWAMTFGQAVQNLAGAIVAGQSSVSIPLSPGAGGHGPFTFNFNNPGVTVGPDKISATLVMGSSGLMAAMMTALGGQNPQNIASNASNASAQKVYALMLDYWFAQLAPAAAQPTTPVSQAVAPAVAAASVAANNAAAIIATTQPVVKVPSPPPPATAVSSAVAVAPAPAATAAVPSVGTTTVAPAPAVVATPATTTPAAATSTASTASTATGTSSALTSNAANTIQSLLAQGASQNSAVLAAIQAMEAQGVPTAQATQVAQTAATVPASTGLFGLTQSELLWVGLGGFAIAALLYMKK